MCITQYTKNQTPLKQIILLNDALDVKMSHSSIIENESMLELEPEHLMHMVLNLNQIYHCRLCIKNVLMKLKIGKMFILSNYLSFSEFFSNCHRWHFFSTLQLRQFCTQYGLFFFDFISMTFERWCWV